MWRWRWNGTGWSWVAAHVFVFVFVFYCVRALEPYSVIMARKSSPCLAAWRLLLDVGRKMAACLLVASRTNWQIHANLDSAVRVAALERLGTAAEGCRLISGPSDFRFCCCLYGGSRHVCERLLSVLQERQRKERPDLLYLLYYRSDIFKTWGITTWAWY